MSKKEIYAIYLRKSRADIEAEKLGEGETLARHKKILTELAVKQERYVGKIFHEIVSGETIEARPEMQQLIKECYEGKYRGIIVIDVDRLSRGNQGDMQQIMDCLKFSNNNDGLLVITPTKTYDVAHNSDDEEYMEFVLFMSRREYKTIQKRLERGRRQAVVEGNFMGSYRPYGFNIKKTKTSRFLVPNPEEAPTVKMMFEWTVNDNLTTGEIGRKLDALGIPTYTGLQEWNAGTIKEILTNPVYKGSVRWNDRMRVKTMVDGEIVSSRPRSNHTSNYMEYDGKHEALVTKEMFDAAASRFHSDKTKANLKLINPLAGILVCAKCQKVMHMQTYKSRPNTESRFTHPTSKLCTVKSATEKDVMNAVIHGLKLNIEEFSVKIDNTSDVNESAVQEQLATLRKEIITVERKLVKIFDDYENELYSANEFVQRKQLHNERLEEIKRQIHEIESTIPEKEEYQEKIMKLSDALNALLDSSIDADIKNEYLKAIIEKIEFSRENNDEFILDIFLK